MKKHKDTLFRMLFSSRENLLSLYNAVNGTHYTDHPELELLVRILNINLNKNPEILDACQTLKEYMQEEKMRSSYKTKYYQIS